jgi:hypothetical protein
LPEQSKITYCGIFRVYRIILKTTTQPLHKKNGLLWNYRGDPTYKEVAQKMALNPRSVDNLRDQLFVKLDVKSRVGLAMVAIKNGIVTF